MLYETAVTRSRGPPSRSWSATPSGTPPSRPRSRSIADGVTGAVDMALGADGVEALERALAAGGDTLPLRVAGHWLIEGTESDEENVRQVHEAVEHQRRLQGPWLRMAGIKIIIDGVIDSCTAAMKDPYSDGTNAEPIWELASLSTVVVAADAAGLQVALHAIGDEASEIALAALEQASAANGIRPRRHRMEHLETSRRTTAAAGAPRRTSRRCSRSMPIRRSRTTGGRCSGDHRVERAFPWPEMTAAGAVLALASDAPTAPHPPLPNMYIATTRKSALDGSFAPRHPQYALPLEQALAHATRDAAASVGDGGTRGRLEAGLAADFAIVDVDPFAAGPESLLTARVVRTVVAGQTVYDADAL